VTPAYFLQDHAVSYTYSARYLQHAYIPAATVSAKTFMGLAPVEYAKNLQLSTLSGSDLSLHNIESFFTNVNHLESAQASRYNFLQQFPGYRIIQLYTHASDSSERKEPVIYFADSALYLSELMTAQKPLTQLIVLSACETGGGNLFQGEGVFKFNRGFAALGIPSSISNLWTVDNVSTYQLMELFYKYLAGGLPLDLALQRAKLEYINTAQGEHRLPYYWAAAVLVGKTNPIGMSKDFAWKYVFAGIGLAGLSLVWWKKIRKPKKINPVPDKGKTAP
jgi:CHAT domain-containing protein